MVGGRSERERSVRVCVDEETLGRGLRSVKLQEGM